MSAASTPSGERATHAVALGRARGERGSTLIELLIASAIMGTAVVALLVGLTSTFVSAGANRQSTTSAIVVRDYAESLDLAVTANTWCSASYVVPYTPPSQYSVSATFGPCPNNGAAQYQTVTITVTGSNGSTETLNTVVRVMTAVRGILARWRRPRGEAGSALVLALLFLTVCGVTMGALLTFTGTSSDSTIALRTSRANDYDVEAAMQAAIATVRIGLTCPSFTPSWTLNNPSRPLRVDCVTLSSTSGAAGQRNDVLTVCPSSVAAPCPDGSSLLRVNVIFYDTFGVPGSSLSIRTWSNQ